MGTVGSGGGAGSASSVAARGRFVFGFEECASAADALTVLS